MEVIRAFQEEMESTLLLEACTSVDLALVLLPSQFQLYQWMVLHDRVGQALETTGVVVAFQPHLQGLATYRIG